MISWFCCCLVVDLKAGYVGALVIFLFKQMTNLNIIKAKRRKETTQIELSKWLSGIVTVESFKVSSWFDKGYHVLNNINNFYGLEIERKFTFVFKIISENEREIDKIWRFYFGINFGLTFQTSLNIYYSCFQNYSFVLSWFWESCADWKIVKLIGFSTLTSSRQNWDFYSKLLQSLFQP